VNIVFSNREAIVIGPTAGMRGDRGWRRSQIRLGKEVGSARVALAGRHVRTNAGTRSGGSAGHVGQNYTLTFFVVDEAVWNALPGVAKRKKVGDRAALIDQLWTAVEERLSGR
jgi:hypothetical protein